MKKIDGYYRTENDAESAKSRLETLKGDKLVVERIPDSSSDGMLKIMKEMFTDDQERHDPHVIHVEVVDEEVAEANRIINESGGYISKE